MASSSRSSHDQETQRLRAKNLFTVDPSKFFALLEHLFASDKVFQVDRSEARQLFDVAQKEYPDSLVLSLSTHLQKSPREVTRFRCAILLHRLFRPQRNLYPRLSPTAQNELKTVLLRRIREETAPTTFKILINLVSNVAGFLLPKKQWPEVYDYLFKSLKSDVARNNECAALLFVKLIPRCPELFLFYVDDLSEAFRGIMDRTWEDHVVSGAAVGASVELVLHLATPSSHEKYYDLLNYMVRVLSDAVDEMDASQTQRILEDMIVLAGAETRFLRSHIDYLVEKMLDVAENYYVNDKTRELVVEFVTTVAEDREYGCGMIQNIPPVFLKRLFAVLFNMLASIEDDPSWDQANSDSENEGELGNCCYAMQAFSRLVMALRENVIIRNLPDCLPIFLEDLDWQRRHAAITALGLIADGCSKASLAISETLLRIFVQLWTDLHPRVRWATIRAIGQFSKNWGPHFQGEFYGIFLPGLVAVMENFDNPRLQILATSTMLLFSKNCSSDIFNPYLKRILSNLCILLQKGNSTLKEAAFTSLASLADSFQEEFQESYDAVLCYMKVNLAFPLSDPLVAAKTLECMTMIGVAIGKERFMTNVDKVVKMLKFLQACSLDNDDPHDPIRCPLLQAWGKLCKCLGTEFVPYLSLSMPQLLRSAQLTNYLDISENSDDSDDESLVEVNAGNSKIGFISCVLDEKAIACNVLCSFAAELAAEIHLWINEILDSFLPLLTFKFDDRVRTAAISAMPLILHSASSAMKERLPLQGYKPVKQLSDIIIPALSDSLRKESKIKIQVKILEALNKCIQISGSCLNKSKVNQFVEGIAEVLIACSHTKTERKRRVEKGLDRREKGLLKEEIELDDNVYKAIADCLSSIIKIFKASFLPIFDKLLPCLALMCGKNSEEERTIFLHICRDVAEQCREDAFKHYEERLLLLFKACDLANPDVWKIVAHGIKICAEFGGNVLKPHLQVAVSTLEGILKNPNALHPVHVVAHEIAVVAFGKMCQFHCDGPSAYQAVNIWLSYLPLRNNLAEAKLVHDDLCTMIEKSENKVLGPRPQCNDFKKVIKIFAEVMWAGNNLATEDTLNRMKKLLKRFQQRMLPSDLESICSSFPFPLQTMLHSCFSS
ncbi:hypothetical protein Pfo_008001 [Paulownia fortunei]|nr:hypothetical protein Pfo_008001 [Paulownia fortunei]